MRSTSAAYARIYDKYFTGFVDVARVHMMRYFNGRRGDHLPATLLDVCCGTGRLACYFGKRGYQVYGVDNSTAMLDRAKLNAAAENIATAAFLNSDALSFELPERVSFATATTNALCSLGDLESLTTCCTKVRESVRDGGVFIFDMNTIAGMRQANIITVREFPDEFFIVRTIFDDDRTQAIARASGFVRHQSQWERFDDTMIETTYHVDDILSAVNQAGWRKAWAAALPDLDSPLRNPEDVERCFFVAEA